MKVMKKWLLLCAITGIFSSVALLETSSVQACTRILWNSDNSSSFLPVVGRTMDWPQSTQPVFVFFPKGMKHNGGKMGTEVIIKDNPVEWTSKHDSLVITAYGVGAADGVNDQGLAAHMLYLTESQYPERDTSKPGLQVGLWAQYVLDNAATVKEALNALEGVQIVGVSFGDIKGSLHLVIEDKTGDSAIIEYIDGKAVVHHNPSYDVVTNDPSYDVQLQLLKNEVAKTRSQALSGDTPLPGNVSATDRFQRASYFLNLLPKPANEQQAIAGVMAIARNVSVPFGAPYQKRGFSIYNTEYRTAIDLKKQHYFFETPTQPNVIWVTLKELQDKFKQLKQQKQLPENPVLSLELENSKPSQGAEKAQDKILAGDVASYFKPTTAPY